MVRSQSARYGGLLLLAQSASSCAVVISSASLWSRSDALPILYHPTVVSLACGGALPRAVFLQAVCDRALLIDGLNECFQSATSRVGAVQVGDGHWSAGRWIPSRGTQVVAAAAALQAMWEDERKRSAADHASWTSAVSVDDSGARLANSADCPSEGASALAAHLQSARGPFAQLGSALPIVRTLGWACSALAATEVHDDAYSSCLLAHAKRWTALADAGGSLFDDTCAALEAGALSLSEGGALIDVEGAVALREAQTSMSLLLACVDSLGGVVAADGATESETRRRHEAACEKLDVVEPGWLGSVDQQVFIRGVGLRDMAGQVAAKGEAATCYLEARQRLGMVGQAGEAA